MVAKSVKSKTAKKISIKPEIFTTVKQESFISAPARRRSPRTLQVTRPVKILPARGKTNIVASASKAFPMDISVKRQLAAGHCQNLVNPNGTTNRSVTGNIKNAFKKTVQIAGCAIPPNPVALANSSSVPMTVAVKNVSMNATVKNGVCVAPAASQVVNGSTPKTPVSVKRDVTHKVTFGQAQKAENIPVTIRQCEGANPKVSITPKVEVQMAVINNSHMSGTKGTYTQAKQPGNRPVNVVQVSLPNKLPQVNPTAKDGQTYAQPVSVVPIQTVVPSTSSSMPAKAAKQSEADRVPQGSSNDAAIKAELVLQGPALPKARSSKVSAGSKSISPCAINTNVPPQKNSDTPNAPGESSVPANHASAALQHAPMVTQPGLPGAGSAATHSANNIGAQNSCLTGPSNSGNRKIMPRPPGAVAPDAVAPGAVVEEEPIEIKLPFGNTTIKMSSADLDRHIPVWNCKQMYKLAGTSAPLGKNLVAYLLRKEGEFEVYNQQDTRQPKGQRVSARVTLWNKLELRKISGTSAPLRKNLPRYLGRHPECEVYDGQYERLSPAMRRRIHHRVTLWNKIARRRTGFGSAGPLRKNLKIYLQLHPYLEEYVGQDRYPAPVQPQDINTQQETVANQGGEDGQAVHHQDGAQTIQGQTEAETIQGQTDAETIQGQVEAQPIQGQVEAQPIQGQVEAQTIQVKDEAQIIPHQGDAHLAHKDEAHVIHHQEEPVQRHPESPCGKRRIDSSSGEMESQIPPNESQTTFSSNPLPDPNLHPIDLSDLPDLNIFPIQDVLGGAGDQHQWYNGFGAPSFDAGNVTDVPEMKEEDEMHITGNMEVEDLLDTQEDEYLRDTPEVEVPPDSTEDEGVLGTPENESIPDTPQDAKVEQMEFEEDEVLVPEQAEQDAQVNLPPFHEIPADLFPPPFLDTPLGDNFMIDPDVFLNLEADSNQHTLLDEIARGSSNCPFSSTPMDDLPPIGDLQLTTPEFEDPQI